MNADEIHELKRRHAKGLHDLTIFQQWIEESRQRLDAELSAIATVTRRMEQIAVEMHETSAKLEELTEAINEHGDDGEWWKFGTAPPY